MAVSTFWNYYGEPVRQAATGEVPLEYRPGKLYAPLVQDAINCMRLRASDRETWVTIDVREDLRELVVAAGNRPRIWGVHVGHRARDPRVSPFVKHRDTFTRRLTVHVAQRDGNLLLVRVYPGEYRPPLPWQNSARNEPGGDATCRKFWREHAYVYNPRDLVRGTQTDSVPDWF